MKPDLERQLAIFLVSIAAMTVSDASQARAERVVVKCRILSASFPCLMNYDCFLVISYMVTQFQQTDCSGGLHLVYSSVAARSPGRLQRSKRRISSVFSRHHQKQHRNPPIEITYPGSGNNSQFSFDGIGRNAKIIENTSGSTTSTKQFLWSDNLRSEERDVNGALTKQFFKRGQRNSSTNYVYDLDRLGSIRNMADGTGSVQAQYQYDPFGKKTTIVGLVDSDFQYSGYYTHSRSGLSLTLTRAYSSDQGRFISRDPIGEDGGINLFRYVLNNPIKSRDPFGLRGPLPPDTDTGTGTDTGTLIVIIVGTIIIIIVIASGAARNKFPPKFPDCPGGDVEACQTRWDDCQSRCRQFYENKPGPGNDLLDQCLRCCASVWRDCRSADGGTFPGSSWDACFQNKPNCKRKKKGGK